MHTNNGLSCPLRRYTGTQTPHNISSREPSLLMKARFAISNPNANPSKESPTVVTVVTNTDVYEVSLFCGTAKSVAVAVSCNASHIQICFPPIQNPLMSHSHKVHCHLLISIFVLPQLCHRDRDRSTTSTHALSSSSCNNNMVFHHKLLHI